VAVNATGEELLWRGLFVAAFPEDPVWGWLWPAVGFTARHPAPQAVLPARRGKVAVVAPAPRTHAITIAWPARLAVDRPSYGR
jgi:hypothetical protein